jgi:hypothetical protein
MIMSLLKYGIAVGLGYALGRPEGRAQLARAGRQAADLGRRPEVAQLRERGKDIAAEQAQKVKQKVASRSGAATGSATSDATADATGSATFGPETTVPATPGRRLGLRNASWRPRFSRSRDVHFPSSEDVAPAPTAPLAGTTVMEDSQAAAAGTTATPRPGPATPTERP